jgi:hypothetical protein
LNQQKKMTEEEKRASCLISQQENIGTFIAECKKKDRLVPIHSSALADSQHRQAPALYILQVDGRQTAGH